MVIEVDGIKDINLWTSTPGGSARGGDRIGSMFLELLPETQRTRTGTEILEEIRERTKDLSGFSIEIEEMSGIDSCFKMRFNSNVVITYIYNL